MKDNNITVYLIEYQGNVKYVGKTCDYKRRVREHRYRHNKNNGIVPTDVNFNDVTFKPIQTFDNETDALCKEDELILQYDTINTGWNRQRSGLVWSSDTKAYKREYRKKGEYKAYQREYMREWEKTEKRKAYKRERQKTEEYKAYHREWMKQYRERKKTQKNGLPI